MNGLANDHGLLSADLVRSRCLSRDIVVSNVSGNLRSLLSGLASGWRGAVGLSVSHEISQFNVGGGRS